MVRAPCSPLGVLPSIDYVQLCSVPKSSLEKVIAFLTESEGLNEFSFINSEVFAADRHFVDFKI